MAASLVMLSLGSIPQSFAGTTVSEIGSVSASLVLGATCGIATGSPISYGPFAVGATNTATTSVTNGGTVDATLDANAGISNTGGGFVDGSTTHIAPSSMRIQIDAGTFSANLDNLGNDVTIPGGLTVGAHTLGLETTATIINAPVVNPTLSATIFLTAEC